MNTKNLIIGLSLATNLALGFAFLKKGSSAPAEASDHAEQKIPEKAAIAPPSEPEPPLDRVSKAVVPITWEAVESGDYLTYIDNLRSIGCPEETIQDIISADVNKLYDQRWKQIKRESGGDKFEYWKSNAMFGGMSSELRKQYKELDEERRGALESLLGKKVPRKITDLAAMYDPFESMLGFLPQSKRDAILEIQQMMSERMMDAAEEGNNLDAMDWQKVQQEQKDALAEILTPEELLDYNLRMSNSANMLRNELSGFEVSEDEFRKLYALREAHDDEFSMYGPAEGQDPQEWSRQRSEGQTQLKESYKEVLGDDRYREYQHEQTFRGSSLRNVAKEFDLPREDIYSVYDTTDAAQEAARVIRENQSLDEAQRQAALDQIRAETEAQLSRIIGDEATQSYIDQGSRIKNLNANANGQGSVTSTLEVSPTQEIRFTQ